MPHIKKADIRLVSGEAGEIFDDEVYGHLSWLAARHSENTCSGARLLDHPMDEQQAFEMMDCFDLVSGYIIVDIQELLAAELGEVKRRIANKLVTGVDIEDLIFEVVWGHSQTLMLYASGKTSG